MAPTDPTDHDLNAMLARVCRIPLNNMDTWWQIQYSTCGMEWNPLHDANQMENVKAALRKDGWHYMLQYDGCEHIVAIYSVINDAHFWQKRNSTELRAFALAVYAMEQGKLTT